MAGSLVEEFTSRIDANNAASVIAVGTELLPSMMDQEKQEMATHACAACWPAILSAMQAHPTNGDVQRVGSLIFIGGLGYQEEDEENIFEARPAEVAAACVAALGMCLTTTLSPMEELPAIMCFGSNRGFEKDLLFLLLKMYEPDGGLALLEAGIIPHLMKAIQFVDDASKAAETLLDQYGNEKPAACVCKQREIDLLQCLLRSQPSCREAVAKAGACDALLAAMQSHASDRIVCAGCVDALAELAKDESCHDVIHAALQDPNYQEAIRIGNMSEMAQIQEMVRAGLKAHREDKLVEKAEKLGLVPSDSDA